MSKSWNTAYEMGSNIENRLMLKRSVGGKETTVKSIPKVRVHIMACTKVVIACNERDLDE